MSVPACEVHRINERTRRLRSTRRRPPPFPAAAVADEGGNSSATRSGGGGGGVGPTRAPLSSGQQQGSIPFFADRQQQHRTPTAAASTMPSSLSRSTSSVFDARGGHGSPAAAPEKFPAASTPRTERASPPSSCGFSAPFSADGTRHRLDDSRCDNTPRSPPSPPSQLRPAAEASPPVDGGNGKRRMLLDADIRCADGERPRRAECRLWSLHFLLAGSLVARASSDAPIRFAVWQSHTLSRFVLP